MSKISKFLQTNQHLSRNILRKMDYKCNEFLDSSEQQRKKTGELKASPQKFIVEVIDPKLIQNEAYIGAQCIGNYKINQNKSYYMG